MAESTKLPRDARRSLPRAVIVLGWVSFFTDASADMIYPLVPAFLVSLGGGAMALGWLEGVAEAVSAAIKLWAGRAIDRAGHPKRFVVLGYGLSALSRPLYALATAPVHAVLVRVSDRIGKGLRGPPRDAMLAAVVDAESRGHAFGFHRMMDNFGGVAGPILAFFALRLAELPLRTVFLLSVIPGLASVVLAQFFLKEPKVDAKHDEDGAKASGENEAKASGEVDAKSSGENEAKASGEVDAEKGAGEGERAGDRAAVHQLPWRYFAVVAVFTLAGSGDLFLMRRLTDLRLDVAYVPVAWVSLQLLKGLFNVPGGRASDRFGRRRVLAIAWLLYAGTYAGFGFATSWWSAWLLLVPYAIHYGLAEGGQRALLTDLAPKAVRGRAFGIQLAIEGIFILPANVGFGFLMDRRGPVVAFAAAAVCAAVAAVLLLAIVPSPRARSGGN
jgi:MFS family permease